MAVEKSYMARFEEFRGDEPCDFCGVIGGVKVRQRNTQYCENHLNYVIACDFCMEIDDEYNKERWAEYNSMRI
jgi:hypothetical protein